MNLSSKWNYSRIPFKTKITFSLFYSLKIILDKPSVFSKYIKYEEEEEETPLRGR